MNLENNIIFQEKNYKIIACEHDFIIHPTTFQIIPITLSALQVQYYANYTINDYKLYLEQLTLEENPKETNRINGNNEEQYIFKQQPLIYTGSIIIGQEVVKEYYVKNWDTRPCFSYKYVYELVFKDGILTTTIDHSKAMLRIRKNIELGLRSLNKNRDLRCIKRFIKSSLVGDYDTKLSSNRKKRYLSQLSLKYSNKMVSFSIKN